MIRLGGGTQDSGLGYTPFTIPDLYPPRAETVHWVHQWISATTSIPNCQAQAGLYVCGLLGLAEKTVWTTRRWNVPYPMFRPAPLPPSIEDGRVEQSGSLFAVC